ncbi:MAG: hypothetical protein HXM12_07370 [Fusobacterium periodonticum]|jgi:hypothetical protein|nr:hypothetical protein [Fusobacterium periodonticum]
MDIKIRGVSNDVLAKIDALKKDKSRNEFLLNKLNEIALAPELNATAIRYEQIIKMTTDVIEKNNRILSKIFEVSDDE